MKTNELLLRKVSEMEIFRILAECYDYPSGDLAPRLTLLQELIDDISPYAAPFASQMSHHIKKKGELKNIQIDHAELFVGPFELLAPPYASVYIEGHKQVMGASTLKLLALYREEGLDMSDQFKNPPDHIIAELEFMYYLKLKEVEALADEDVDKALKYYYKQRQLLENHLALWIFEFIGLMELSAKTQYHKCLGKATRIFIRDYMEKTSELTAAESRQACLQAITDSDASMETTQ